MPQQPRPGNDNSAAGVYGQATEYLLPSLSDDDTDDEQQSRHNPWDVTSVIENDDVAENDHVSSSKSCLSSHSSKLANLFENEYSTSSAVQSPNQLNGKREDLSSCIHCKNTGVPQNNLSKQNMLLTVNNPQRDLFLNAFLESSCPTTSQKSVVPEQPKLPKKLLVEHDLARYIPDPNIRLKFKIEEGNDIFNMKRQSCNPSPVDIEQPETENPCNQYTSYLNERQKQVRFATMRKKLSLPTIPKLHGKQALNETSETYLQYDSCDYYGRQSIAGPVIVDLTKPTQIIKDSDKKTGDINPKLYQPSSQAVAFMMQRLNSTKDMGNEPRNKIQEHSNDDLEEDAFFHCQRPSVSLKQTPQDLYTATSLSSYPNKTADNHVKQIFTRPEGRSTRPQLPRLTRKPRAFSKKVVIYKQHQPKGHKCFNQNPKTKLPSEQNPQEGQKQANHFPMQIDALHKFPKRPILKISKAKMNPENEVDLSTTAYSRKQTKVHFEKHQAPSGDTSSEVELDQHRQVITRLSHFSSPWPLLFDVDVTFEQRSWESSLYIGAGVQTTSDDNSQSFRMSVLKVKLGSLQVHHKAALIAWLWMHVSDSSISENDKCLLRDSNDNNFTVSRPRPVRALAPFSIISMKTEQHEDNENGLQKGSQQLYCILKYLPHVCHDDIVKTIKHTNVNSIAEEFQVISSHAVETSSSRKTSNLVYCRSQSKSSCQNELFLGDIAKFETNLEPDLVKQHTASPGIIMHPMAPNCRHVRSILCSSHHIGSISLHGRATQPCADSDDNADVGVVLASPFTLAQPVVVYKLIVELTKCQAAFIGLRCVFLPNTPKQTPYPMPLIPRNRWSDTTTIATSNKIQMPILALAFCGQNVTQHANRILGPPDSSLASRTDPDSIHAIFSQHTGTPLLCGSSSASSGWKDVVRWFGPYLPTTSVLERLGSSLLCTPSVTRVAVLLPPTVPLLSCFTAAEYIARLGLCVYSFGLTRFPDPHSANESKQVNFVFVLSLYGDWQTQASLLSQEIDTIITENSTKGTSECLASHFSTSTTVYALEGPDCRLSQSQVDAIIGAVGQTPTQSAFYRRNDKASSVSDTQNMLLMSELPSVCVVTVQGATLQEKWEALNHLMNMCESKVVLIACKLTPIIEAFQARILSPFELGHPEMKASVKSLCKRPLFAAVLAGHGICNIVARALQKNQSRFNTQNMNTSVSAFSQSYTQMCLLFNEREVLVPEEMFSPLIPAPSNWCISALVAPLQAYLVIHPTAFSKVLTWLTKQKFIIIGGEWCNLESSKKQHLIEITTQVSSKNTNNGVDMFKEKVDFNAIYFIVERPNAIAKLCGLVSDDEQELPIGLRHRIYVPRTLEQAREGTLLCRTWLDDSRASTQHTTSLTRQTSHPMLVEIACVVVQIFAPRLPFHAIDIYNGLLQAGYEMVGFVCGRGGNGLHSAIINSKITPAHLLERDSQLFCFAMQKLNGVKCQKMFLPENVIRCIGTSVFISQEAKNTPQQLARIFAWLAPSAAYTTTKPNTTSTVQHTRFV